MLLLMATRLRLFPALIPVLLLLAWLALPSSAWAIGDGTPPDTVIDSGPSDPTNSTSATFTFHGTDTDDVTFTFECSVDGGSFNACNSGDSFTVTEGGPRTFDVRAYDPSLEVDPS